MKLTTPWLWIGIALGAVWAVAGVDGAAVTALLGALGLVVGLVIEGRVDLRALVPDQDRDDLGR